MSVKGIPNPPKNLKKGGPGRRFWYATLKDFILEDNHHLELLGQAAGCLDRIEEAQEEIEKSGGFYKDRSQQPREHPGHKTERDNRILFARLLRELQLDASAPEEARPPQLYGVKKSA